MAPPNQGGEVSELDPTKIDLGNVDSGLALLLGQMIGQMNAMSGVQANILASVSDLDAKLDAKLDSMDESFITRREYTKHVEWGEGRSLEIADDLKEKASQADLNGMRESFNKELKPLKIIVYGAVGMVLTAVFGALIALVVV